MSRQKNIFITSGFVLSISLIIATFAVAITSQYYSRLQFKQLNAICGEMLKQNPKAQEIISVALKEYTNGNISTAAENEILSTLGYSASDFADGSYTLNVFL